MQVCTNMTILFILTHSVLLQMLQCVVKFGIRLHGKAECESQGPLCPQVRFEIMILWGNLYSIIIKHFSSV